MVHRFAMTHYQPVRTATILGPVAGDDLLELSKRASTIGCWVYAVWFAAGIFAGGQIINHTSHDSTVGPVVMVVGMFSGFFVAAIAQRAVLGRRAAAVRDMRNADRVLRRTAPAKAAEAKRVAIEQAAQQRRLLQVEREHQAAIPGSPEWKKRRYAARVQQVRRETGVEWQTEFYVRGRSPRLLQARALMRSLEAIDRRV